MYEGASRSFISPADISWISLPATGWEGHTDNYWHD